MLKAILTQLVDADHTEVDSFSRDYKSFLVNWIETQAEGEINSFLKDYFDEKFKTSINLIVDKIYDVSQTEDVQSASAWFELFLNKIEMQVQFYNQIVGHCG